MSVGEDEPGKQPPLFGASQETNATQTISVKANNAVEASGTARGAAGGKVGRTGVDSKQRKPTNDPGADLERRVARIEFAEGALARLRVPVFSVADSGRGIITDLDVVSLDVDLRLRLQVSILECKSGKGQAGEPDRLLWLSGLKTYVRAQRASLVRQTVSVRGRAVASHLNINVMDVATLQKHEEAHAWMPSTFGHIGGTACARAESLIDDYAKTGSGIPTALISALRNDVWIADPHSILGSLSALERYEESSSALDDLAGRALSGHALTALIVAALRHSHEFSQLSASDFRSRLETTLSTGSAAGGRIQSTLAVADRLFELISERIHDAYVQAGALRQEVAVPAVSKLAIAVPSWVVQYMDFLEALALNPSVARDLLQTVELSCFDALLGETAHRERAFDHLFTPEHRQLLRVAVRTLGHISGDHMIRPLDDLEGVKFDRSAPAITERRAARIFD